MVARKKVVVPKLGISISNPEKVLYPAGQFTKTKVIDYYVSVAPFMLPHLHDRPVTLKRFPDGVFGQSFYEKDAPSFTPEWVQRTPVPRRDPNLDPIQYILVQDVRTLAWLANLACLELHPFLHQAPRINQPTQIVFDLDPGEGVDILGCAEVAFLLQEVLSRLKLECFPKVSGSKGIQVYVPLNSTVTYESTRPFANALAELLARQHPDRIVSEMAKALRTGKVFIDWSQNAEHKTTVSVYSLRAKGPHPYVSLPVSWKELKNAMKSGRPETLFWEADAALARLKELGDLFEPVLRLKQSLPPGIFDLDGVQGPERAIREIGPSANPALNTRLKTYESKRDFSQTPEPAPAKTPRRSAQGGRRRFVIQKHAASHLHYDFRLELGDALKSWAVPKGVPLTPGKTVSAFATEDHPLDYLQFEGTIPQGEYGGGTVMVWDLGTYELIEGNYWKGRMVIHLEGNKLKGEWTLDRKQTDGEKVVWLLRKSGRPIKLTAEAQLSVLSGRTMDQIAADTTAVWHSNRLAQPTAHRNEEAGTTTPGKAAVRSKTGRGARSRTTPPEFVPPMKPTLVTKLPEGADWIYEVKWDGYRALASKHGRDVSLLSLRKSSLNSDFPAVLQAVRSLNAEAALLDGEIVAVNEKGQPSFQALRNRKSLGREWHVVYYAFDLLQLEGEDLKRLPLDERREKLKSILDRSGVRFSAGLPGSPDQIIEVVKSAGLEGVIAKRRDSIYRASSRTKAWLKLKLDKSQEFVIGGYNPDGNTFQSLLVGYYTDGQLHFAGKVRQGFRPALRRALVRELKPLVTDQCPFVNLPTSKKSHFGEGITAEEMTKLVWLKPRLVAQCSFTEWTSYGLLRHATFIGLRDDKEPADVIREQA